MQFGDFLDILFKMTIFMNGWELKLELL